MFNWLIETGTVGHPTVTLEKTDKQKNENNENNKVYLYNIHTLC